MSTRRELLRQAGALTALTVLACAGPTASPARLARVGYLAGSYDPSTQPLLDAFHDGLTELGYIEGKTMQYELRWGEGNLQRFEEYANELVRMPVDVMATSNTDALRAMKKATSSIPIVVMFSDPVEAGWVQSLARPGGNITGVAFQSAAMTVKRMELLKEAFPTVSRIAVLSDAEPIRLHAVKAAEESARTLGLESVTLDVPAASPAVSLARAFEVATAWRSDALFVLRANIHVIKLRAEIIGFAAARRIPDSYPTLGGFAEDGGLMAYGENSVEAFRRGASVADRILKGANPAELPMEQPTTFDLVLNLKTARERGLTIAPSILARATKVIQ